MDMELNSVGGKRYEQHDGWQALRLAQRLHLPSSPGPLLLSCNDVNGELLGGHDNRALHTFVLCRCPACSEPSASGGTSSRSGRGGSKGGSTRIGPQFNLEDWFVHCQGPDWEEPLALRQRHQADRMVKKAV
ncbi:hypothetical protein Agub_g6081, partial [Astrephomene gubernaculifera]